MKKGMNKRGLSDVVTTVLIILFAIVAVAVVGGIVLNQINKAGKNIDKASFCTENIVEPVTCQVISGTNINVGYTRTKGDAYTASARVNVQLIDGNFITMSSAIGSGSGGLLTGSSGTLAVIKTAAQKPVNAEIVTTYSYKGSSGDSIMCTSQKIECNT